MAASTAASEDRSGFHGLGLQGAQQEGTCRCQANNQCRARLPLRLPLLLH